MVTLRTLLALALSSCFVATASADRTLSRTEILDILSKTTSPPRKTWIPAGTIVATHQEYKAPRTTDPTAIASEVTQAIAAYNSVKKELTPEGQKLALEAIPFNVRYKLANESRMTTGVTLRYDGERFYWETNVVSRSDTVRPDATLAGNYMTDEFNVAWNQRRIAAWDGQKYTTCGSGGSAVEDWAGKLPRVVKGPLTAGLIPWGYGKFRYTDLSAAQLAGQEVSLAGATRIELSITHADGSATSVTLDPAKAYAVTNATLESLDNRSTTYTCSSYKQAGTAWVPWSVAVEKRDRSTNKLLSSEQWTITSLSTAVPALSSFAVPYTLDTVVESISPVSTETSTYLYSPAVDTDDLLTQRLAYAAAEGSRPQNCATAALQHVAGALGKQVPADVLAGLVGAGGQTSMYQMKRAAQGAGLYARAVQTDLAGLRDLAGVKAVLYLPGTSHFVVLSEVDDQYVWLIDLSSQNFHYRRNADLFPTEWSGVALLVSARPLPGRFPELADAKLATLTGGYYWSCTKLFQTGQVIYCSDYPAPCSECVSVYFTRYVCEIASSGTCTNHPMVRKQETPCVWDPIYDCSVTGEWYYAYMSACY